MITPPAPARPRAPATPAPMLARTPRLIRRAAWGMLLLLAALVPLLLLAPWTQTVHGVGRAIAFDPVRRPQAIVSPIQGRVMKWHVKEGDRVRAGQRMVDLVDNDPRRLEMLREQRLLAQQRQAFAETAVTEQEGRQSFVRAEAPLRVAQAQSRMEAAEAAVPLARQELKRAQADEARAQFAYKRQLGIYNVPIGDKAQGGALSKDQLEETERQQTLAKERVPLVQAQIDVAVKQHAAAEQEHRAVAQQTQGLVQTEALALAARRGEAAAARQSFESVNSDVVRQENQSVAAPTAGTVFRVLANAEAGGQLVNPGQQLAVLVPDVNPAGPGPLAAVAGAAVVGLTDPDTPGITAELVIDGNDLPLVRKGDRTLVQFEGWAAVQFAAYPEAAAGTFEGLVYLVDPTSDGQGKFRILVEPARGEPQPGGKLLLPDGRKVDPWPDEQFLRQGVRAQGWVIVQDVRLGYELWRLLNGFPPARPVAAKDDRQVLGVGPVGKK